MSLKKIVLIKSIGVPAEFHTVTNVVLAKTAGSGLPATTQVTVNSYYNQDVYAAGANALANTTITVQGTVTPGQDVWTFADEALSAAAPAGADTTAEITLFQAANPYVFAGATIV